MLVLEFKAYGNTTQYQAVDEGIRVVQFIRNKALRYWMDTQGTGKNALNQYCAVLAQEFPFAEKLNSMARQASAERSWSAIARFYAACRKQVKGKKGFPQFQKNNRSIEYKTTGWKLATDRKSITFTDKLAIGRLKMKGTRDLNFYQAEQIKRVRLVRRSDGYYVQFCVQVDRTEDINPTGKAIGLDVGLKEFYTDSNGQRVENPRFYRSAENKLKRTQRRVSRKQKGSNNRKKAVKTLGQVHLKVSRQRKDHAVKLARCVITSNDVVVYEDLRIQNLVKNHGLAKSINDAGWYQFRIWLEYFAQVFGKVTVAVNPAYTSQECSACGAVVQKSRSTRTHTCQCGCELDRDHNAAINILNAGLRTVGHTGTFGRDPINAWGEMTATESGATLVQQVAS